MRVCKSQCSLFKDYYRDYLKGKVDEETKDWMKKHKEECGFCREWAKSFEESREDIVINNSTREEKLHTEKGLAKKVRQLIPLSAVAIALKAIWTSIKLSS